MEDKGQEGEAKQEQKEEQDDNEDTPTWERGRWRSPRRGRGRYPLDCTRSPALPGDGHACDGEYDKKLK